MNPCVQVGLDYEGDLLNETVLPTFQDCHALCENTKHCKVWTWDEIDCNGTYYENGTFVGDDHDGEKAAPAAFGLQLHRILQASGANGTNATNATMKTNASNGANEPNGTNATKGYCWLRDSTAIPQNHSSYISGKVNCKYNRLFVCRCFSACHILSQL